MSTSRRDFLKSVATTLALLPICSATNCNEANAISGRTSDNIKRIEYVGRVRVFRVDRVNDKSTYLQSEDVNVQADSDKNAFDAIQKVVYARLPRETHFAQVEQISLEGRIVYNSITDDTGALLGGAFLG